MTENTRKPDMKPDMKPDISATAYSAGPDTNPDKSWVGDYVPPQMSGWGPRHVRACPGGDVRLVRTKAQRTTLYEQWKQDGQPWPPPAGLTSGLLSALIPNRSTRR